MGARNFLIEGVSGAGKTTVAEELERRGHHVIHGDRTLAYVGNPLSGQPLDPPFTGSDAERVAWDYAHWIWPVGTVRALLADTGHDLTFFCGGSRNSQQFIDGFELVFRLDIDVDTLRHRLAGRGDDEFGGKPVEREMVEWVLASGEGLPRTALGIDAMRPVREIVDEILSHCRDRH